jgi:glycosyltransferase involved in cell wall biosynthesis
VRCELPAQSELARIKVMRLITRMNLGGPALYVCALSKGLEGRGYDISVIAGVCQQSEGDIPADIPPGLRIGTLPGLSRSISPLRDLGAVWNAYRMMRRERPTIVHTETAKAGMVGRVAAFLAGVPIVIHTFHGNSLSGYFSPRVSAVLCGIERLLGLMTDRICVVSNQQLEEISGTFRVAPRTKFQTVPLGLDLGAELAQQLPEVKDGVLNVGWLGRLVEIKGIPLLTAVIDEAARRALPLRFHLAGDGPEAPHLRDVLTRYGPERVTWSGWRRDVSSFLANCDVLIQTSRNEGTPVALIQGMAAGRPFVSTPVGGVVDLVCGTASHDEAGCQWYGNGVLAGPDPAAFVHALERFRSQPSTVVSMGSAARRFAAERFQASRLIDDMDRLYRELLEEKFALQAATGRSVLKKVTGECG